MQDLPVQYRIIQLGDFTYAPESKSPSGEWFRLSANNHTTIELAEEEIIRNVKLVKDQLKYPIIHDYYDMNGDKIDG